MVSTSVFLHSTKIPFGFSNLNTKRVSVRRYNEHLPGDSSIKNFHSPQTLRSPLRCSYSNTFTSEIQNLKVPLFGSSLSTRTRRRTHSINPFKCSYTNASYSEIENPLAKSVKNLSFTSLKWILSQLTPLDVCKLSGVLCFSIAALKWTVNLLLNPFFWMYFSWTWLFWPWFLAISLAIYGLYCLRKHLRGEANIFEQLVIVTSAITWLTLVPPAHFNGFLEGWPFVFFFVYHYFFFFNASVRKRLYGDYYTRDHDPKWDVFLPISYRLVFSAGVLVGHCLAALEGPELHLIPGGWRNLWIWVLIMLTLFMQYHSTLYLANYSEKVVVPTAVVQFGPYRWVRHPMYASVMLLLATYCVALRAPFSSLFIVAVCLVYYEQKVKLEEGLMVETFGERYTDYMSKVRYKFIPFLY